MGLIKIFADKEKVKSILEMVKLLEDRIKIQNKSKFASLIISDYYEILKELMTGLLLVNGYKTLSYKDLIDYIRVKYKEIAYAEIIVLDKLRIYRNRIVYEGFKISNSYLINNESMLIQIIKKLKTLINNNLKT